MKKSFLLAFSLVIFLGCNQKVVNSNPSSNSQNQSEQKTDSYKPNTDYKDNSALDLIAEVYIKNTTTGKDTPTEEATEAVNSLDTSVVSLFDTNAKLLDSFTLKKADTNLKGQIKRFKLPFVPIKGQQTKFKMNFSGKEGTVFFETEASINIKPKAIYRGVLTLEQISINQKSDEPPKISLSVDEIKEDEYVKNQLIIGSDKKEDEVKTILEKDGIKVSSLKKGFLNNYTVTFSEPSMSEALIIASRANKFDYVETNAIVKAISF
ncbi:MAG: hypothetical protein U0457_02535 [Candidatus Sericytochromatia bacterium]